MNHGQNLNRLQANLATAVKRTPFNNRDGLLATVKSEVSQMRIDVHTNVAKPVSMRIRPPSTTSTTSSRVRSPAASSWSAKEVVKQSIPDDEFRIPKGCQSG